MTPPRRPTVAPLLAGAFLLAVSACSSTPGEMDPEQQLQLHREFALSYFDQGDLNRAVQLRVDGLVVADMRDAGEKLEVRVLADRGPAADIAELLDLRLPLGDGGSVPLAELVRTTRQPSLGNIRHYNVRRTITVQADLVKDKPTDTFTNGQWPRLLGEPADWELCVLDSRQAAGLIQAAWAERRRT